MCTVSFITSNGNIYLTSNRDEKYSRQQALPPDHYIYNNCRLLFPRDEDKHGTWIATKENGDSAVLLNGAFEPHHRENTYKRSRGLLLIDIISTSDMMHTFSKTDINRIEPFTLILINKGILVECRWDGCTKFMQELTFERPHIWSSVTLYTPEIIHKRECWFNEWLANKPAINTQSIYSFHRFTGDGDIKNNLLMNRPGETHTVSISSIEIKKDNTNFHYWDTIENIYYSKQLNNISIEEK